MFLSCPVLSFPSAFSGQKLPTLPSLTEHTQIQSRILSRLPTTSYCLVPVFQSFLTFSLFTRQILDHFPPGAALVQITHHPRVIEPVWSCHKQTATPRP